MQADRDNRAWPKEEIVQKLVRLAASGDERAFEQLVFLYETRVYRMALYMTGNREDAQDVSQEVFVRLWTSLSSFRGESTLLTYLMRLTKNISVDLMRRNRRRKIVSLSVYDQDGEEGAWELPDENEENNPEKSYLRREHAEKVRRAINTLDADQRQIVVLRDINGLSYREISEVLAISESAVKSRLNRAREKLKKILQKQNFF